MPVIRTPRPPAGEDGFTLIELLVAILAAAVITGALFMILEISLRQTSRITDRVQATQHGRFAMTRLVDELNSACISREFAPVRANSTASTLLFVAAFGKEPVIGTKEAYEHEVTWNGVSGKEGILIDKTFAATGGTWPSFSFSKEPTTLRLAENVYQNKPAGKSLPIFKYYEYAPAASTGTAESSTSTLKEIALAEKATLGETSKKVAAVQVGFSTAASDNSIKEGRLAEFSNLVTFAFASPAAEATIQGGPCE